jgi:hypothetical protein
VSNTEARNEVRFEGPGNFGGTTVQGHLAESRITVLSGASVLPRHLNKHIDYDTAGTGRHEGAQPATLTGIAVSPNGATLTLRRSARPRSACSTPTLQNDTFDPVVGSASYIDVSGGGPSGSLTRPGTASTCSRFDDAVSVVDLATRDEIATSAAQPRARERRPGRPFLYDAALTSSNGEAARAATSSATWTTWRGPRQPRRRRQEEPDPDQPGDRNHFNVVQLTPINGSGLVNDFHPMKGPMTTQTLRGMKGSGAMHWRGDRSSPPGTAVSAFDENVNFNNFNVAFPGLVGNDAELPAADMQKFTDFALQIMLPPNPNRRIDGTLNTSQQAGKSFFMARAVRRPRERHRRHRHRVHVQRLPRAQPRPPVASARAGTAASRTRSRSSRSRTCGTSTRRSACSARSTSSARTS